jgi:dTDP-4-amino-4,6-dideoxygalactose transaminase
MSASLFTPYPLEDYKRHQSDIDGALLAALNAGHYILGSQVTAFEKEFAGYIGAKHCIGVANGTDSIELLLRGLGIGAGAKVAVPSQTAVASISSIARAGATPVFLDVDGSTFTITPESLEATLAAPAGAGMRAVLAVHLYGHPADMRRLQEICDRHGLVLLEDCAQAHGATHNGTPVGSMGRGGSFSFYPTKNLGAIGDGGGVTTDDDELADNIRCIRQYGWRERYISAVEGINSRLDELQAAILRVKLRTLPESIASRRRLASIYNDRLSGLPVRVPTVAPGCEHAYHLYVIRTPQRDELMKHLNENGVPAALHYPAAVHQQPAYEHTRQASLPLPETDALVKEILSLPLHPWLSEDAVLFAAEQVRAFFTR